MMLLGSGTKGEKRLIDLETMSPAPTIAGYIDERINLLAGTLKAASGTNWITQVAKENVNLPQNLYLLAGDGNLELLAAPLAYYANAQFPAGIWGSVHRWVLELIEAATDDGATWTVFIDTNPSFSIYTELAMIAATKLLVPFNADDSSRHAVSAISDSSTELARRTRSTTNSPFGTRRKRTDSTRLSATCSSEIASHSTRALRPRFLPCRRL